jgi:PAS domain S-box-containing protein
MYDYPNVMPAENRIMFFKAQFDDSPLGFIMADTHGRIEYINRAAMAIIGYDSLEEACSQSMQEIDSVFNCGFSESFGALLGGRVLTKKEHRCTNRKGHFAILNIFCHPYHSGGDIVGVFGILQDVTETAKRKAELEEAIFELSIMSQVSEALSSTADLDEVIKIILTGATANQGLGFNRAFLFLADETGDNLIGQTAVGPGSPEEAGRIWARLSQQQKTLKELLEDYSDRENASNYSLSSLISGWKIPLGAETIFSRAINESCGINISGRNNLSPESVEIMQRLNTYNLAIAPIISKGKKLGLIAADNQITGRKISSSEVQLLQTFANHTAVAIERSRLYDNLVEHANELELKNKQLAESQEQIIRVEKMSVIGELTSSIAHELRNPLTVIGGFANMILSTGGSDSNTEYLNIIISETKRAETVLHHVLDFSRASRTKTREVDFNQLVSTSTELLSAKIKHRHRPPILKLSREKLNIWGNPDQLQHALLQFMLIAFEEMTDECSITFGTSCENDLVRLILSFSGGEEARAKVAKTLRQIFGSSTGNQKLSIIVAGETIKYHGGNYGIESNQEFLPKIYIELPQYRGSENE